MKIKWLGHSAFLITSERGVRIITDPYPEGLLALFMGLRYGRILERADIVTISHNHPDHNNIATVRGNPTIIKGSGVKEVKGIVFEGLETSHGFLRGSNTVFCFNVDGIRLYHLGDLVILPPDQQILKMGEINVLFLPLISFPLMGRFTRNPAKPETLYERFKAKIVIPMHFRNSKCWMPFPTVGWFLRKVRRYQKLDTDEIEVDRNSLPQATEVIVLKPAL